MIGMVGEGVKDTVAAVNQTGKLAVLVTSNFEDAPQDVVYDLSRFEACDPDRTTLKAVSWSSAFGGEDMMYKREEMLLEVLGAGCGFTSSIPGNTIRTFEVTFG